MDKTKISKVSFVTVYVDDFEKNFKFYNEVLDLEKSHDMGENMCFFRLGKEKWGIYFEGGNHKIAFDKGKMRTGFVMQVESASAMHEKLKKAGVKFIQDAPVDMGKGNYWFQFFDPAGNILEILGGR